MIYYNIFSHCFIINYLMIEYSEMEDSAKQAGNIFKRERQFLFFKFNF